MRHYLTQDDNSDSKKFIPKLARKNNFADSEDDDRRASKLKHFTPGRIRPSRMDRMDTKKDNFLKSPNNGGRSDLLNTQKDGSKRRALTQNKYKQPVVSADDSMHSAEEPDLNHLLPAVKVQPKRKKRSRSSSKTNDQNDSMLKLSGR